MSRETHGLFLLYTGNGKGKTTAALGLVVRAAGHDQSVEFVQFLKGNRNTGEYRFFERLANRVGFHAMGRGFVRRSKDIEADRNLAAEAWAFAHRTMHGGEHELVVLDELTYPIKYGFLDEAEVLASIADRPPHVHVVVTGRRASRRMIDAADLVTEMRNLKHPLQSGIRAQRGIEF